MYSIVLRNQSLSLVLLVASGFVGCGETGPAGEERNAVERGEFNPNGKADGVGCADSCGKQSPQGCWCDAKCSTLGDCCADKVEQCEGHTATCKDTCGAKSADGCWCDPTCAQYGDCCPDKKEVCDAPPIDPCDGVVCNTPPKAECADMNTLQTFAAAGQCSAGNCAYPLTEATCLNGCDSGACAAAPAPVPCSYERAFADKYQQPWSSGDVAFVTADGMEHRGVDALVISTDAMLHKARVTGNPTAVTTIRLLSSSGYQILAERTGDYIYALQHVIWKSARTSDSLAKKRTRIAEAMLRQFTQKPATVPQLKAMYRLLIRDVELKLPAARRASYRAAADTYLYDLESGKITTFPYSGHALTRHVDGWHFRYSTSLGLPPEIGVEHTGYGINFIWLTRDISPTCDGCSSDAIAGKTIRYCDESVSWQEATNRCVADGGLLATINNADEDAQARSLVADPNGPAGSVGWIGLDDRETEGHFIWQTGTFVPFTNWHPGEPNDSGGNEDCTIMQDVGALSIRRWNDIPCDLNRAYFCELP